MASALVASQPIPHTVSVGYSITPPRRIISTAFFNSFCITLQIYHFFFILQADKNIFIKNNQKIMKYKIKTLYL
jgi:hypothetical protein